MKAIKNLVKIMLLVMACMLVTPNSVTTLTAKAATTSVKTIKKEGQWQKKNQKMYYVVSGKKQTGLVKIKNKTYYFDKNGVQKTGWQKISGKYYFFKIANGKDGCMQKSQKINGISIKKNGTATITSKNDYKIKALIMANQTVEKITKPTMTKEQKLKKCYDYCVNKIQYRGSPKFEKGNQWDAKYVINTLNKGRANCYAYGATFAYMARAIGYTESYTISSGGHGWAEVNGKVYDVSWEKVDKKHSYYGVSYSLSGKGGRPNYKKSRTYVKKV